LISVAASSITRHTGLSDALYHARTGAEVEVEMRNEAMETHVVREANLLAVPRTDGQRVFADVRGQFWRTAALIPPSAATGPEGDCLSSIDAADGVERFSLADSGYLGAKEVLDLTFEGLAPDEYGLVIGCRQTLLSTYLLYQTLEPSMGSTTAHSLCVTHSGSRMMFLFGYATLTPG
jgi:hypothetical protein